MAKVRKVRSVGCDLNMTPMIDVVFQLIIFFVVTLKMTKDENKEIELEDGKHGPIIKEMPPQTLVIELDRRGRISIHNARMGADVLRDIIVGRVNRFRNTNFPVLIRADHRTPHREVKRVMDVCTGAGIWKLSFVAIQEHKANKK